MNNPYCLEDAICELVCKSPILEILFGFSDKEISSETMSHEVRRLSYKVRKTSSKRLRQ